MRGAGFLVPMLAAAAAATLVPQQAAAQCRLCETPTTALPDSNGNDDVKLELAPAWKKSFSWIVGSAAWLLVGPTKRRW